MCLPSAMPAFTSVRREYLRLGIHDQQLLKAPGILSSAFELASYGLAPCFWEQMAGKGGDPQMVAMKSMRDKLAKAAPNTALVSEGDGQVAGGIRTPEGEKKQFQIECKNELETHIDKDDLADLLGNLIENAVKYARRNIYINVAREEGSLRFEIGDDGEGISSTLRDTVQKRGVRLDQSIAGTGLGLAIVNDILTAYDQNLELGSSPMGGLKASFRLPLEFNV